MTHSIILLSHRVLTVHGWVNRDRFMALYAMRRSKNILKQSHMMTLYYSLFYPYIDYGITLWGASYTHHINKLQTSQKKAIRLITGSKYNDHTDPLFRSTKMLKIKDMYEYKMAKFMYLFNTNILPKPISEMLTMNTEIHDHFTRNRKNPHIQYRRTQIASKTLRHRGPIFLYKIPSEIKAKQTVKSFGYFLKRNIVETYPISWINLLLILDCHFAFYFIKFALFHLNYFSRELNPGDWNVFDVPIARFSVLQIL